MEQSNKIERSEAWNNIYEVLARLDLKDTTGDALDRPSAATEIEALFLKLLGLQNVSVSVADVRQAFADYFKSEGCSCCRDTDNHDKAEAKLAELLKPDAYDDGSGFNWYKYATER